MAETQRQRAAERDEGEGEGRREERWRKGREEILRRGEEGKMEGVEKRKGGGSESVLWPQSIGGVCVCVLCVLVCVLCACVCLLYVLRCVCCVLVCVQVHTYLCVSVCGGQDFPLPPRMLSIIRALVI